MATGIIGSVGYNSTHFSLDEKVFPLEERFYAGLTALDLSWRDLDDVAIASLQLGVRNIQLLELNLEGNKLTKFVVGNRAVNIIKLTTLNLRHNQIHDEGAKQLTASLAGLPLTALRLAYNPITVGGKAHVVHQITRLTSLTVLNLDGEDNELADFPASGLEVTDWNLSQSQFTPRKITVLALRCHANLTALDLSWSRLGDMAISPIVDHFPSRKMRTLNLQGNHLIQPDLHRIIGDSLTTLKLGHNQLNAQGLLKLIRPARRAPLTELDLSWNQLTDDDSSSLAVLSSHAALTALNLEGNGLSLTKRKSGSSSSFIATALAKNTRLVQLKLGHNRIKVIWDLVNSLNSSQLKILDLSNNQIGQDELKKIIQKSNQKWPLLMKLDVTGNPLTYAEVMVAQYKFFKQTTRNECSLVQICTIAVSHFMSLSSIIERCAKSQPKPVAKTSPVRPSTDPSSNSQVRNSKLQQAAPTKSLIRKKHWSQA